jgi:hypothetical protein
MENIILKSAIKAFKKSGGLRMDIEKNQSPARDLRIDAVIKMKTQQKEFKFLAEIKPVINASIIGFLLHHKNDFPQNQLLVSNYVNPIMAEKLKDNEINFIDTVGNAYINTPPVFIFVKGNKQPLSRAISSKGKAFTPSGLKMIYALLCDEKLLNRSYRDIAKTSGIALGTVSRVIDNLKGLGFVIDMGVRGKKFALREVLFNRWCVDYAERLKPKLLLGRFEGPDNFWEHCLLKPDHGQWGGEVAAFKLTKYLKPQNVTIYAKEEKLRDILLQNKLKRREKGNIEIYKKFWPIDGKQDKSIVHPFIIYSDLLEINNQRTIETAREIYDQNIAGYFRES